MAIGLIIRDARIKKGMTQEELAEKTDISIRTIQRIESGVVDPRSYTLSTIAKVLEIDYENLINDKLSVVATSHQNDESIWLPLLHLSGLFVLLLPPLIIWIWKKDQVKNIRQHAIDVINFQLSMWIFLIPGGLLVVVLIGLPIVIFIGIFSTIVILMNTIRVINRQPYKYPLSFHILKS